MARFMKGLSWLVASALVIFLIGLGLIYFLPEYDLALVRSESMVPAIKMGDVIITGPHNGLINWDIKPGTIVTYQHGKDTITHRVLSIDGENIVTKGDALEDPDPWPVTLSDVRGIYLFKIPFIGFALNFIRTKFGWFLTIIIPAAILVGWLCWDILKEAFGNVEKTSSKSRVQVYQQIKEDTKDIQDISKEAFNDAEKTSSKSQGEVYPQIKEDAKDIRIISKEAFSDAEKTSSKSRDEVYHQIKGDTKDIRDILKESLKDAMEQESRLNELRQKIELLRNRKPQITQLEEHMTPLSDAQENREQKGGEAYRKTNGCAKVGGAKELSTNKK